MTVSSGDQYRYRPAAPAVIDTDELLERPLADLATSPGPVGVDTERACGFRYSGRAYLIQMTTPTTPVYLIDPINVTPPVFARLDQALENKTWILHAASQDLPSLRECGLNPHRLFDTELSARLLGHERVGLGALVEEVLGVSLAKDHANSDWSTRPLPQSWLSYAAGDVEFLADLATALTQELADAGKLEWANQEFAYVLDRTPPPPKTDPWRSTTDIHQVRTRRGLALVREVWQTRDAIAQQLDLSPHRIVTDRAIAALAVRMTAQPAVPADQRLLGPDWRWVLTHGYLAEFRHAIDVAMAIPEPGLPPAKPSQLTPPTPGSWRRKSPEAAARWSTVRPLVKDLAEAHRLPVENLISPRALRGVLWEPAGTDEPNIDTQLANLDVRPWQRQLVVPLICEQLAGQATPERPGPAERSEDS